MLWSVLTSCAVQRRDAYLYMLSMSSSLEIITTRVSRHIPKEETGVRRQWGEGPGMDRNRPGRHARVGEMGKWQPGTSHNKNSASVCQTMVTGSIVWFVTLSSSTSPTLPTMSVAWQRLIRFVATDGRTLRGEPVLPSPDFDLGSTTEQTGLKAKVITGDDIYDTTGATKVTDEVVTVKTLLGPLAQSDVSSVRCIGLNYISHSMSLSEFPQTRLTPHSQGDRPQDAKLPLHVHQARHHCT